MTEADSLIAALAGAAIGGLVAALRQWLRIGRENARTLNRVLYLLDVRHTILRADPDVIATTPSHHGTSLGNPARHPRIPSPQATVLQALRGFLPLVAPRT